MLLIWCEVQLSSRFDRTSLVKRDLLLWLQRELFIAGPMGDMGPSYPTVVANYSQNHACV